MQSIYLFCVGSPSFITPLGFNGKLEIVESQPGDKAGSETTKRSFLGSIGLSTKDRTGLCTCLKIVIVIA